VQKQKAQMAQALDRACKPAKRHEAGPRIPRIDRYNLVNEVISVRSDFQPFGEEQKRLIDKEQITTVANSHMAIIR
jgi:hypothetical protein